jgi:hypothetical protein
MMDLKVCKGLKYVFFKDAQGGLQKHITWPRNQGKANKKVKVWCNQSILAKAKFTHEFTNFAIPLLTLK